MQGRFESNTLAEDLVNVKPYRSVAQGVPDFGKPLNAGKSCFIRAGYTNPRKRGLNHHKRYPFWSYDVTERYLQ